MIPIENQLKERQGKPGNDMESRKLFLPKLEND
jgi:hypothetical protein